jgi:hypothetical protein
VVRRIGRRHWCRLIAVVALLVDVSGGWKERVETPERNIFLSAASEHRFLWLPERPREISIGAARAMIQYQIIEYLGELSLRDCHWEEIGLIRSRDCVNQRGPARGLDVTLLLLSLVHSR